MHFQSSDPEATLAFAKHLGQGAQAGDVFALSGDLGAGKTTFVRGLAEGMGVADDVTSPTYTLMHAYEGSGLSLFHYDAWMEGRQKALLAEGGAGELDQGGVCVVEWASRVQEFLPDTCLAIDIQHVGETTRILTLCGPPALWEARVAGLPEIPGGAWVTRPQVP